MSLAPRFVSVALGIALAVQCVSFVAAFLPSGTGNPDIPKLRRPVIGLPRASIDVQSIVSANLFGVRVPEGADASDAPLTQLPLVLTATFAMPASRQGYAILGDSIESARLFSVGASVADGTILNQVFNDRVTLDRSGRLETLQLPRDRASPAGRFASASTPASGVNSTGQGHNPSQLVRPFMPSPAFRDGHYRGMRVAGVRDADRVAQLGLKAEDVITEINGTPLTTPQMATRLLRDLGTTQMNVTIERGGETLQAVLSQ